MAGRGRTRQPGFQVLTSRAVVCLVIAGTLASVPVVQASVSVPEIIAPINGSVQPGATPAGASAPPKIRFRGTSGPSATVDLVDTTNGTLGTTSASDNGVWELALNLGGGAYTVTAIATDPDGTISPPSEQVMFEVDAVLPVVSVAAPTEGRIFGPGDDVVVSGTANDDDVVYAVRLEYWLANRLMLRELAQCELCGSATGVSWRHEPALTTPGFYHVRAQSFDSADNRSAYHAVGTFVTLTRANRPVPLPATPFPPTIVTPEPGSIVPGGEGFPITIGGKAPPGSTVIVTDPSHGNRRLGTTRTIGNGATGYWSFTTILEQGNYGLRARYTDTAGRTSGLSAIARFYVDGTKPVLSLETERELPVYTPLDPVEIGGQTADDRRVLAVRLEYWLANKLVLRENASCPLCPVTSSAAWEHTPDLPYPGYYHVRVIAIDRAGHHSPTQVVTFVVA